VSGRQGSDGSWSAEPASLDQRGLGSPRLATLWAALVISGPTALLGFGLSSDGLGLSLQQMIIAVPLGAVIGATVLSLAAWAGAYNGVPTVLALRPAFGSGGAALLGVALAVTLVCWAAVQLQTATEVVAVAFEQAGLRAPQSLMTISVIGLVSAVLVLIGPAKVATYWVSRVVFWVAVVAVGLAIWLLSTQPDRSGLRVPEQTSALWLGIDAVLALGILWFPLVGDVSRFATDESVAASGTALGFGSTAVIGSLVGGTAALLGAGPANIAAGITSSLPGFAGLIVVLVWMLTVQTLLPFAVGYVAGMCATSITGRRLGWAVALGTVAAIVVLAIVLGSDSVAALEPPLVLVGAVASVYLMDFYVVRRRMYRTDQFYGRGSMYGVLNPSGLLAVAVGVAVSLLVQPVGPAPMVEWIEGLAVRAPFAGLALPGLATAMVLAGLMYWILGGILVREEVVVSPVRL
jgi:purine-cytosine permease-like protein